MRNKYNMEILEGIRLIKELFDENFKIIQPDTQEYDNILNCVGARYHNLNECYGSYSIYKEKAYEKYQEIYFRAVNYGFERENFGINSYNTNQFTLCMALSRHNIVYKIYITKCYNKLIAVKEVKEG